jgi:hypothetical protein
MKKLAISLAFAALATAAFADVPQLLNYQGNLSDPSGIPKNGTFSMQFTFYDAEAGGNQLPSGTPWSETQNVTVTNGVFNVLLGSVTALPEELFAGGPSDLAGPLRYLQVSVSGENLVPRQRVGSAAYSIHAGVTGFANCTWREGSQLTSCLEGEVLIGGGCKPNGSVTGSYPELGLNAWRCVGGPGPWTGFANCCR